MNAADLVPTHRETLAGFTADIERLEAVFASWDETQRSAVDAYRRAIEQLQAEAFRRLIRSLKSDQAALTAMKEAVADDVVYAVLRHHNILKPSLSERVEAALDGVRPILASHGGDVELVAVKPPAIEVRFTGACDSCAASALTFHAGVKKAVEQACPEITDILQVKGAGGSQYGGARFVSPFASGATNDWHPVCRLDEIPQGGLLTRIVAGHNVVLSRQGSVVSCFQNACAHLGLEIDGGTVENGVITCPWHGFRYDLATGECLTAPEVQLQAHGVKVIGNGVEVRLT